MIATHPSYGFVAIGPWESGNIIFGHEKFNMWLNLSLLLCFKMYGHTCIIMGDKPGTPRKLTRLFVMD